MGMYDGTVTNGSNYLRTTDIDTHVVQCRCGWKYQQMGSPISRNCGQCGRWMSSYDTASGVSYNNTGTNSYIAGLNHDTNSKPQYLKPVVKTRSKILNLV